MPEQEKDLKIPISTLGLSIAIGSGVKVGDGKVGDMVAVGTTTAPAWLQLDKRRLMVKMANARFIGFPFLMTYVLVSDLFQL